MKIRHSPPRILVVTPEITFLPQGMGSGARSISARAGGLGDICAAHLHALCERGIDVHLAMPNYRNVFKRHARGRHAADPTDPHCELPTDRIHLAQDRNFFYHPRLFSGLDWDSIRIALAFQREVMHAIIPSVQPDLIHCYGWMTGLVPAMARLNDIPCFFTPYGLEAPRLLLATVEERGIDAALFWQDCYYDRMPANYEETRDTNPLDLLSSGVFAAEGVVASKEIFTKALAAAGTHHAPTGLGGELLAKFNAGRLLTALPSLDASFNPAIDRGLVQTYRPANHSIGKMAGKRFLQEALHLEMDAAAPVFLWPTRLDSERPGCRMIADRLAEIMARFPGQRLQIVFVADGDFQVPLRDRIRRLQARGRAAVSDFDDQLWRRAYAGADFVLVPLHHDPCALPSMIGQRYGALPIVYDTGAIHDCVTPLDAASDRGNGFVFENFDVGGLLWALDQAMAFYRQPPALRASQVRRIMADSLKRYNPENIMQQTIDLYARVLARPLADHDPMSRSPSASHLAA